MENKEHSDNLEQESTMQGSDELHLAEESLKACELQMQEWKGKCLRITADFENFKKRQEKERAQWEFFAQITILKDLLDIIDNFDRAGMEQQKEGTALENNAWYKGFEMIEKSFAKYLDKIQVREIKDVSLFNPQFHEAVTVVESDKHESGEIVAVLQKGYMFKEHLLRPAKVSIAQ